MLTARARWWLPAIAVAGTNVVLGGVGLAVAGSAYIPQALVMLAFTIVVLAARRAERHRFRQGWFHGRAETLDEVMRRLHGRDLRTSPVAARRAVTGSDAPEPWEDKEWIP